MRSRRFLVMMLAATLLFSMVTPSLAYSIAMNKSSQENQIITTQNVYLKWNTFDPINSIPAPSRQLSISEGESRYFIIQLDDAIVEEWELEQLDAFGVQIQSYVPDGAFIAQIPSTSLAMVKQLDNVRWIGAYQPAYKVEGSLWDQTGEISINVQVFDGTALSHISDMIQQLGGTIVEIISESNILNVVVSHNLIDNIAYIQDVKWIEQSGEKIPAMNNIRILSGADTVHLNGYDGNGIVGEVKEDGFDRDHYEFSGQILAEDGNIYDNDAHGTCTFGIIFAKGVSATAKGMLPGAQGVFCDWDVSRYNSVSNLWNNWGGVFQSNSWLIGAYYGDYSTYSQQNDNAVYNFDHVLMLYAAANDNRKIATDSVAKNVICVGALNHYNNLDWDDDQRTSACYGPANDGRIKPDLCAAYDYVYTTDALGGYGYTSGDYYSNFGGTSAATPITAGAAGLVYQMFEENHFGNNPSGNIPHAATVKALLINHARQYPLSQATRYEQGWGYPDVEAIYNSPDDFIVDEEFALTTGQTKTWTVSASSNIPLKATLVWTDRPGTTSSSKHLINDLSLKVTAPDSTVYWGNNGLTSYLWSPSGGSEDHLNNVENVFIQTPQNGNYTIEVSGYNIPQGPQDFSLVVSGVSEQQNTPPDVPINPSPSDGATDVSLSPTLSVYVNDADGDTMTVSFYQQGGGLIGTDTVAGSGTATTTWSNANQYNTTYYWYTIADDSKNTTQSATWHFTTQSDPNTPPGAPSNLVVEHYGGGESVQDTATSFSKTYSEPTSNDYTATHTSNDIRHIISEDNRVQGGSGKAALDITYNIPISSGTVSPYTLYIESYKVDSDDSYSVSYTVNGGGGESSILTLPSSESVLNYQISGVSAGDIVNVNIKDSVMNPRENVGTVYIDHLYIESAGGGGGTDDNRLTWDASGDDGAGADDVATYNVYRSTVNGEPWNYADQVTADNSASYSYIDSGKGTADATRWWYIVRAEDTGGLESSNSNSAQEPGTENNPPYTPSNPNPTDGATGVSITTDLSWTGGDPDSGDTVEYDVYFGTSATPPYVATVTTESYDPGTLAYETTYYWQIIARDNHLAETTGPIWSFTTETEPVNNPPYQPSNPDPYDGETNVDINHDLSWTGGDPDSSDTVEYDVYFGTSATPPYVATVTTESYDPGTLAYETTYYWQIIARDNHLAETTGPIWSFTTETESPPGGMYVWDISWREKQAGKNLFLYYTVTVRRDSDNDGIAEATDALVSGATVYATLTNLGSGAYWDHSGVTDASGQVEFGEKISPGNYQAEVTNIVLSGYTYTPALDVDNPDYHTVT